MKKKGNWIRYEDGKWRNLDFVRFIGIEESSDFEGKIKYSIYAIIDDVAGIESVSSFFQTKIEAQIFLDNLMNSEG